MSVVCYLLFFVFIKQMCTENMCLLCSEVSEEIDVLQEIYIDELQSETDIRLYSGYSLDDYECNL